MKRLRRWLLAFVCTAMTAGLAAAESVLNFRSRIEVQVDASLLVTEQIQVRAEGAAIKHGIYRDYPDLYRDANGLRRVVGFEVISFERDGQPEPWRTERRANGVRVYAGSADVLVSRGVHDYRLTYRTDQQLGFFADHDELYWNVTGNGWPFEILQASAEVVLPDVARVTRIEAYTGPSGAKGRDFSGATPADRPNVATFSLTRLLRVGSGLTVVVGWGPGVVARPGLLKRLEYAWLANRASALGAAGLLIALAYYFWAWAKVGRDPPKGTIIPLYSPPALSPAAARFLWRNGYDNACFAAGLVGLAVKGRLKIAKDPGGLVSVEKMESHSALSEEEWALYNRLFTATKSVPFNSLGHERVESARSALRRRLSQSIWGRYVSRHTGYLLAGLPWAVSPVLAAVFDYFGEIDALMALGVALLVSLIALLLIQGTVLAWRNHRRVFACFLGLGGLIVSLFAKQSLSLLPAYVSVWPVGLSVAGLGLIPLFRFLLRAPTRLGRNTLDQLEGFRRYLSVAEKDRLNLENPPDRTPELFDRFLPYALALDVEQEWAAQFAQHLSTTDAWGRSVPYSPVWYSGDDFSPAQITSFPSSLGSSLHQSIAAASLAPGSSSGFSGGGDSGGGGGGSSGGGGGGGGGGGW